MDPTQRAPAGPRGATGAAAEAAAASHLHAQGWTLLGRNLRIGRDEVDLFAREPAPSDVLVVVEVRARSRPGFGAPEESVDARKVGRLYRAAWALRRRGHPALDPADIAGPHWRVDLLTLRRGRDGTWSVDQHLRGLHPP